MRDGEVGGGNSPPGGSKLGCCLWKVMCSLCADPSTKCKLYV